MIESALRSLETVITANLEEVGAFRTRLESIMRPTAPSPTPPQPALNDKLTAEPCPLVAQLWRFRAMLNDDMQATRNALSRLQL